MTCDEESLVCFEDEGLNTLHDDLEDLKLSMKELSSLKDGLSATLKSFQSSKKFISEFHEISAQNFQQEDIFQELSDNLKVGSNSVALKDHLSDINPVENQLGLKFQNLGDNLLKIIFTRLCTELPDKSAWLVMKIMNSGKLYSYSDSFPALDNIDDCFEELNASQNLPKFLYRIRHSFKKVV